MKKFIFTLFLCLLLSPVSDAISDNSIPFCVPVYRAKLAQYLQSQPAAGKKALFDDEEPRTVRMIYFVSDPNGFRQEVVDKMKSTIREVQHIFADQIRAHGFGEKTFNYETDAQGEPRVHVLYGIKGNHPYPEVISFIEQRFDLKSNIYFIVLGNEEDIQSRNILGLGLQLSRIGGWAMLRQYIDPNFVNRAAHELGHAFGLWHNFNDDAYIMSYGSSARDLSEFSAGHLAVHPHFNSDSPTWEEYPEELPKAEVLSPRSYPTGATSVPIQLELSDPDGLQQVSLFLTTPESHFAAGAPELKTGRLLRGTTNTIVDLRYDGIIPSDPDATNLSTLLTHKMRLEVVDTRGNIRKIDLSLLEESTHKLIIPLDRLKEPRGDGPNGVAFSPDGKILAAGTDNLTVELWNAETGAHIATLEGYEFRGNTPAVHSVAFSPDGKILATGTWHGSIKLWDVATRTEIKTFRSDNSTIRILSVAFSPDGKILAAGISDGWRTKRHGIRLWDMDTKTYITELTGHTHSVQSVAFSPDGKTLASGAFDSTIRLWDMETKTEITKFPYEDAVFSVSFSPDGKTLVSSAWNDKVAFWDVEKKTFKEQFEIEADNFLRYVSFTPDGEKIVTASQAGDIDLWDTNTYERIVRFQGNTNHRLLGAFATFSPDGTTLATSLGGGFHNRQGDYTIVLWDLSPYVTPVVHIADFNLKAAIRATLGKSGYGPITRTDMARLTTLDVSNRNIRDLIGLEFATNLTALNLGDNPLSSTAIYTYIPDLQKRGVEVQFDKPVLSADFDGNGTVDVADFLAFVDRFGLSRGDAGYEARYDLDGDGVIGIGDFLIFVDNFGKKVS